jgi:hypothetical protein
MNKLPKAYFVSHNGLGDNITNIGAVRFLLNYYETIYFLCKDIHEKNVEQLFTNMPVVAVPFYSNDEIYSIKNILQGVVVGDIFPSGCHRLYIQKRITHPDLLNYKQNDKHYTIEFSHIRNFYYDIGLDLSIYYEYFEINSSDMSKKYYDDIKEHKIIFVHSKSSNREVNYDHVYETYKDNQEYLIVCANKNMYKKDDPYYAIADKYVNIYVAWYIDIMNNAELLYLVDSCFSCIVLPLIKTNKIKKERVHLHIRN